MASAGIFKQSMGARNRVGIGSLESNLGIIKSLKNSGSAVKMHCPMEMASEERLRDLYFNF